jgi:hypothetical protein
MSNEPDAPPLSPVESPTTEPVAYLPEIPVAKEIRAQKSPNSNLNNPQPPAD